MLSRNGLVDSPNAWVPNAWSWGLSRFPPSFFCSLRRCSLCFKSSTSSDRSSVSLSQKSAIPWADRMRSLSQLLRAAAAAAGRPIDRRGGRGRRAGSEGGPSSRWRLPSEKGQVEPRTGRKAGAMKTAEQDLGEKVMGKVRSKRARHEGGGQGCVDRGGWLAPSRLWVHQNMKTHLILQTHPSVAHRGGRGRNTEHQARTVYILLPKGERLAFWTR